MFPTLQQVKADKRYTVFAVVWVLLFYNLFSNGGLNSLAAVLTVVAFAVVLDLAFSYALHRENYQFEMPLSALVTGSIVSAVITPSFAALHVALLAVVFAVASKQLVRFSGMHIFNPANFGILVVTVLAFVGLLPALQTWWAATPAWLAGVLVLIVVYRINGWFAAVPFVVLSLVFSFASGGQLLLFLQYSGTMLFFAGIMLVEPMTSPRKFKAKGVYGVLAAVLAFIFSIYAPDFAYVGALALVNVAAKPLDKLLQN